MNDPISQIESGEIEVWIRPGKGDITYQDAKAYKPELIRLAKLGQQRDWIPVTERLPEDDDVVLVWIGTTIVRACIASTPHGKAWYIVDRERYLNMYHITHWMPLPALPEQEGR